jgi:hypothetical protein
MIVRGTLDLLANDQAVKDLVGADGVYRNSIPQTHRFRDGPAVSVRMIGNEPTHNGSGETGLVEASLEVECWSLLADTTYAVADAVRLAFRRNRRTTLAGVVGVATFELTGRDDDDDLLNPRGTERVQGRTLLVTVWYQEHTR